MNKAWRKALRSLPTIGAAGLLNIPTGSIGDAANVNGTLPEIANRIASILTFLAYPLAFIGIVYSVFLLIAHSDSPDAFKTTKKNIGYIAGGIFIIIFSVFIFNFIALVFNK